MTCHWGLKASFHPSRQAELADHERQRLASVESSRRRYPSVHFVDCTGQIEGYFKGDGTTDEDLLLSLVAPDGANDIVECHDEPQNRAPALCEQRAALSPANLSPSYSFGAYSGGDTAFESCSRSRRSGPSIETEEGSVPDASLVYEQNPKAVPSLAHTGAYVQTISQGPPHVAPISPSGYNAVDGNRNQRPLSLSLALSQGSEQDSAVDLWTEPEYPLDESETFDLLHSFLTYTATWSETTDSSRNLSIVYGHDIVAHRICMAAALALSCRHRSSFDDRYKETALQLYQYTIKLLIQQNADQADPLVLTACILLCVYEMISADVADWRRHLKVR